MRNTADAALDSRFMAVSADLGAEKVHGMPNFSSSDFNLESYFTIVRNYLLTKRTWSEMGQLLGRYWIGVETPDFM